MTVGVQLPVAALTNQSMGQAAATPREREVLCVDATSLYADGTGLYRRRQCLSVPMNKMQSLKGPNCCAFTVCMNTMQFLSGPDCCVFTVCMNTMQYLKGPYCCVFTVCLPMRVKTERV